VPEIHGPQEEQHAEGKPHPRSPAHKNRILVNQIPPRKAMKGLSGKVLREAGPR
jgi:hypothetical protein